MDARRAGILEGLKAYEAELVAVRRDIHRHPETGFEERRTAAIVAEKLRSWGLEVAEGIARTGVVGTLKGARPGQRAIGLRADLDALNIKEAEGRDHRSTVPGKMHACGHDGHTAMLLGAARSGRHVGRSPGLVDKDEPSRIEAWLHFAPIGASGLDISPALLGGAKSFF